MTLQPDGQAPYTSASAMIVFLDAWRDKGLPTPIDRDTLIRAGVSESIAPRTHQSLVTLGLIGEDGEPSEQFEEFRSARGDDEYRKRFEEWLRGAYADVLSFTDPSEDTATKVAEAFRVYEPAGQRKAMASLFIGLWRYAGLNVAETTSQRPAGERKAPTPRSSSSSTSSARKRSAKASQREANPPLPSHNLPPALVGLLQQIPSNGRGWTESRRASFLTAFEAVLNYSVPIVEHEESMTPEIETEDEEESL